MIDKDVKDRLRAERDRLGLTQAAFADQVGVTRVTQNNYEQGRRVPDFKYLQRLGKLGVDFGYVISGDRSTAANWYGTAAHAVLPALGKRAGFNSSALLQILHLVAEAVADAWREGQPGSPILLETDSLVETLVLHGDLMAKVFGAIEEVLLESKAELGPLKKAELVQMLTDAFKSRGRIDKRTVAITVKAALP